MPTNFAARHTASNPDWMTPPEIVDLARIVLGGIDLDPASDAEANQTVRAVEYYSQEDNGLTRAWRGRVFLNPPGGLVNDFWLRLQHERLIGHVQQFIWIGYSLEQLQTLQTVCGTRCLHPLAFSLCVPRRRIAFIENAAKRSLRGGARASSPSHGNYICGGGPAFNRNTFWEVFTPLGQVVIPQ